MIKDIKLYEGLYSIDKNGTITNLVTGKIKKPVLDKVTGYFKVQLWSSNCMKCFFIHRLVAQSFIAQPSDRKYVNHKNGVKTDNRLENLEWCTNRENAIHSLEVLGNAIFDKAPNFIGVLHTEYGIYTTANEAAKMLGISKKGMLRMLNGEKKNTSFFKWSITQKLSA